MKKNSRSARRHLTTISPEEAPRFLEDIRTMASEIDEPTTAISLRIPGNILRALKLKAKADGKKYQSLIVEYLERAFARSKMLLVIKPKQHFYQGIGSPSRKRPPLGPPLGRVAAQIIPLIPCSMERSAFGPPISVRTQPGQTAFTQISEP